METPPQVEIVSITALNLARMELELDLHLQQVNIQNEKNQKHNPDYEKQTKHPGVGGRQMSVPDSSTAGDSDHPARCWPAKQVLSIYAICYVIHRNPNGNDRNCPARDGTAKWVEYGLQAASIMTTSGLTTLTFYKGAGAFEAPSQTMDELSAIDTSRHPKVLKTGPNHGCQ